MNLSLRRDSELSFCAEPFFFFVSFTLFFFACEGRFHIVICIAFHLLTSIIIHIMLYFVFTVTCLRCVSHIHICTKSNNFLLSRANKTIASNKWAFEEAWSSYNMFLSYEPECRDQFTQLVLNPFSNRQLFILTSRSLAKSSLFSLGFETEYHQ